MQACGDPNPQESFAETLQHMHVACPNKKTSACMFLLNVCGHWYCLPVDLQPDMVQACHPALRTSKALQHFLETSEDEFAHEVARAQMEQGSSAKKTLASTLQLFKDLSHSTANLMSGKHDDEEEDPDYIKVRLPAYLNAP